MKQKFLLILLSLSFISLASCSDISDTDTADHGAASSKSQKITQSSSQFSRINTEGWQTYSNRELGFSVKYPAEWKIDLNKSDRRVSKSDVVFDTGDKKSFEGILVDKTDKSLEEWIKEFDPSVVKNIVYYTLNGQPAARVETKTFGLQYIVVRYKSRLVQFMTGGEMVDKGVIGSFNLL